MSGRSNNASVGTVYAGIQVQTSIYGNGIPIVYGTTRISGNLVFAPAGGFVATPNTTNQSTGSGGGGKYSNTQYSYTQFAILALCEGPITGINQVWSNQAVGSLSGFGFAFSASGARGQTPWPTLSSSYPSQAVPYSGIAYEAAASLPLGSDATTPNFGFEVIGFSATVQDPAEPAAYDAIPSSIITDFLTNVYYGAGWSTSEVDVAGMTTGASSYATYCGACGFVLSPCFDTQKAAGDWLQDILDATNSELVWHSTATGMVLQVVPYGDSPISANGYSYVPNVTPIYNLTYDNFVAKGVDPIRVSRDSTQEVYNCVPVEYLDRTLAYAANTVQMADPVDVALNGQKTDSAKSLHCICRPGVAQQVSLILAQKNVYIRNHYDFNATIQFMLLEAMDLIDLTDPILGFAAKPVRIIAVDIPGEGDEGKGLAFECEEWPFGVATAPLYTTQTPAGTVPNVNVDPGAAAAPLIFNSPALFSTNINPAKASPEVCILTNGGSNWGNADVYASKDGTTYGKVGSISAPARYGTLSATLATWGTPGTKDTTSSIHVTLTNGGTMAAVDTISAQAGMNMLWVDNELITYETVSGASPNYVLTNLWRGQLGTIIASHASGASWGRCDNTIFRFPLQANQVGVTQYVKILSFNHWGGGGRTLSGETAYSFTPGAQAVPGPTIGAITITSTSSGSSHVMHPTSGDYTDGADSNSGSPQIVQKQFLNVTWTFPVNAPQPDHWLLVFFTGTDPSQNQLWPPISVPATNANGLILGYQQALTTNITLSNVNAAICAVYNA